MMEDNVKYVSIQSIVFLVNIVEIYLLSDVLKMRLIDQKGLGLR